LTHINCTGVFLSNHFGALYSGGKFMMKQGAAVGWHGRNRTMAGAVSSMRGLLMGAIACLALTALPPRAFAGDAAKGEIIAKRWCAACHVVSPGQKEANSDAPSFTSVADKIKSSKTLTAFLTDPHPKMPDMSLTRDEIAGIVAYIGTLRK
jgi:mono/diheme cytochrome c family protein